ncbi:MAG TPA: hypothetical protein DCQ51_11345 [Planktothrix sp. UBA8407]|jgi:hypothetical protein|nr:hypothetical protein [Planktothrix sp. UBA8402]HAO11736.1 hypothetical protein [Planktothrix sp. UBA8407]HBK23445.1 hypothetical protein [Planktothrix sp. UBA10369]
MINTPKIERQQIIEFINNLPDNNLVELAMFIDYLRYKSTQSQEMTDSNSSFLLSIAGLGTSGETDISERDEEILQAVHYY